jgi:Carboxypeptidase regulatory-like domain
MFSHCKNFAVLVVLLSRISLPLLGQEIGLRGRVTDRQGNGLPKASVQLIRRDSGTKSEALGQTTSGPDGQFEIKAASAGEFDIRVDAEGFRQVIVSQNIHPDKNSDITVQMAQISSRVETVTVTADVNGTDVLFPDPAEKVFVREDLLDANPGRPGAPVSIPGYPIETASSGIKAPQYFAPGVAGDHGEPIAQYSRRQLPRA